MKIVNRKTSLILRLGITATALLIGQQAMALGTNPGTDVTNTASVDYEVGGIGQPTEVSNAADFVVDRRVDFTVTRMGGALTLTPLSTIATDVPAASNFLDFYVTNLSNGDLDFNLVAAQMVNGDGDIYGGGDADTTGAAEDMFNVRIRVSSAIDPGLPGSGPEPAFGDDDSYIDSIPEDRSIRVRIYADTVAIAANGLISGLRLEATAADPAGTTAAPGADLLETAGVDDPTLVENVFADAGFDNLESDVDGFLLQAAQLIVTKTATVISDPFGSGKAIPGATIEYDLVIDNSAGAVSATAMSIADAIDTDVTFLNGVYNVGASNVSIFDGVATTTFCDAEAGGADTNVDGCVYDSPAAGTLTIGGMDESGGLVPLVVPAGAIFTVSFQVEIPTT
jgi:hypothetical protein